jgi:FkbM family methyltransferase
MPDNTAHQRSENLPVNQLLVRSGEPWGRFALSPAIERLRRFAGSRGQGYMARRMAYLARRLALRAMGEVADVQVFGARLRLDPRSNLAEKRILFTPQYFDRIERDLLRRALPADAIFIDVGANVGAYSFFAASCAGSAARIVAIEPQPAIYERLVANIGFNPGVPIEPVALAIADVDGPIQLFVDGSNAGETSMRRISAEHLSGGALEVMAKPLAQLVDELRLPRVDAMKIDVEGAEDIILVPFFQSAPSRLWPAMLILENSPDSWQTDCVALALAHGYVKIAQTRLNVVLTRQPDI